MHEGKLNDVQCRVIVQVSKTKSQNQTNSLNHIEHKYLGSDKIFSSSDRELVMK